MRIASLASGSGGNAYVIESQGRRIMIDDGLSHKEILGRAAMLGIDLDSIEAILLTHDHADHVFGLPAFHGKHPGALVFANMATALATRRGDRLGDAFRYFENGQRFEIGPFSVCAFPIPHDAADPVGFTIEADGKTYFHCCDLGVALDAVGCHLALADIATLEFNHDPEMLMESNRPAHIKQRIRGQRGHLSNSDAASLVRKFAAPRLHTILMGHMSGECNEKNLALAILDETLSAIGRTDIVRTVLSQDEPMGFFDA